MSKVSIKKAVKKDNHNDKPVIHFNIKTCKLAREPTYKNDMISNYKLFYNSGVLIQITIQLDLKKDQAIKVESEENMSIEEFEKMMDILDNMVDKNDVRYVDIYEKYYKN